MNEMTPETLRELLLVGTTKSSDEVRQMISAAASAWEADRARIEPLEKVATIARRQLHKLRAENDPDALELTNALADLAAEERPRK